MERRTRGLLVGGLVLIGIATVVAGVTPSARAFVKEQSEIVGPAGTLETVREAAARDGFGWPPESAVAKDSTAVALFKALAEGESIRVAEKEDSLEAAGRAILAQGELWTVVERAASSEVDGVPGPLALVSPEPFRSERYLSKLLGRYVRSRADAGDVEGFLEGASKLNRLSVAVSREPLGQTMILWFGLQLDILRGAYLLAMRPELSREQLEGIYSLVESTETDGLFDAVVKRFNDESVMAARGIRQYSEADIMNLIIEGRHEGMPPTHKQVERAMEARTLSFWTGLAGPMRRQESAEARGVLVDGALAKAYQDKSAANYVVLALGQTFEQYGRMETRIAQGRAVMLSILESRMERSAPVGAEVPGAFPVVVRMEGDSWILESRSPFAPDAGWANTTGFEVNQLAGIRAFYPRELVSAATE